MAETLTQILARAYRDEWDNCSGFVRIVAAELGFPIRGAEADDQLDYLEANWLRLKNGLHAAEVAAEGRLVVAGVKSSDYPPPRKHGHVVVIPPIRLGLPVSGADLYRGAYPPAWGGDIGRRYMSQGNLSVGQIFNQQVRDKVKYYTPPQLNFHSHTPDYQ